MTQSKDGLFSRLTQTVSLHYLAKRKNQNCIFSLCHMIILLKLKKHILHRLSIDSFILLSNQPIADVQCVHTRSLFLQQYRHDSTHKV